MKKWKLYQFCIFIALCILLNYGGRKLSALLELPVWLDSFGTVFCAYVAGPVCGSIVGLAGNLISGMENRLSVIYGLTSVAMGVIVGIAAKRKMLETLFGTMSVAAVAAVAAIVVSTPLNILFSGGSTANKWGDGVIAFLQEYGFPVILSDVLGQFYVDFMDKLLTLLFLFLMLRLIRWIVKKKNKGEAKPDAEAAAKAVCVLLAIGLCFGAASARAEGNETVTADYNDYVQTVYGSKNGLPCGEANDIAQTNDGILWIGTYAGLYRYNGREFRWMDNYGSVRNVNCLYVDEEGRLWIGTNDKGLSISINEKITNVLDESTGLSSNSVRSIVQSKDGYYYVGTTGSMQVLSLSGGLKTVDTLWEVNYADDIAADDTGHVAAVTSNGRLFLLRRGKILSSRQLVGGTDIYRSCCFDPSGRLLAGAASGTIYVYDISRGALDEVETIACEGLSNIKDLYYLKDGQLIVSADNGVGYIPPEGRFSLINTNDFNNSIDNMLLDYQGNLWFTSSRLGLLRLAPSPFRNVYSTVGMNQQVVNTIVKWRGAYYFGTDKGLDIVDADCRQRIENDLTEMLSGIRIRCMTVDSMGHLWVCTYGNGLVEVEPDGTQYFYNNENGSFGNRARLVTEISDGTIVAAGDTGISFIRDHRITRTLRYADGLINSMILTVTELADGRILAGTDGDGIALIENGQIARMLTLEDGLGSEVILRTVRDPKTNGVFIVTSNGLCYLDPDKEEIRPLNNFPYFNNYNIWFQDPDTMFVMSSAGIYVVDRDELLSGVEEISYELLDSRRGLNSALTANSWNYYDSEAGLFLPCDTGVFVLDTKRYDSGSQTYRMSLAAVRLDDRPFPMERGNPIEISRSVSKVELFPEIINYTIQDPTAGYYLEGFDTHWTILSQTALNSIVYTNLPTGNYTFHLAVFNAEQTEILSERTYSLVKTKEIYDYPWFIAYILAVPMITVAWLSWFLARMRIQRTLDIQQRELALARQQVQMGNETIIAIAKAVDAKDERTSQHSQRVSQYSVMIARELGFSERDIENLRKAALMHDIGKIGIPDAILNKPARLTDEEYAVMKSHTLRGAEILKDFTLIDHVVEGAQHHHERYDGRGYPDGLKGEEIPLYARIIGVADAFDAMTANRVYRKKMDFDYVLNEMRNGRGTQFDPQMVDILLRLIDEGKIDLKELYGVGEEQQ